MNRPTMITHEGLYDIDGNRIDRSPGSGGKITAATSATDRAAVVVDDNEVWERTGEEWTLSAKADTTVNCLAYLPNGTLLAGCASARVAEVSGNLKFLGSFDAVPERTEWMTPWGGPPDVRSFAVAVDGTVYADIHVGWIVRSTDNGVTWSSLRQGLEKDVHQVAAHPEKDAVVFAATATGFYMSVNRGDTFQRKTEPMPYYYGRACAVFPGTDTYLNSTSKGPHGQADALLLRSTDAGDTWSLVDGLPSGISNNIDTYQVWAGADGIGLVVLEDTSLWHSDDYGASWHRIAQNLPKVYGFL